MPFRKRDQSDCGFVWRSLSLEILLPPGEGGAQRRMRERCMIEEPPSSDPAGHLLPEEKVQR